MKHLKWIVISVIVLLSCQNNEKASIFEKGSVVITGKIDNLTEKTLSVISLEMTGREKHTIRLNEDGSFFFIMDIMGSHDNFLIYNNDLVTFFAAPNDSIYLTANGDNFEKTLKFSGNKTEFNQSLLIFFDEFGKTIENKQLFKNRKSSTPPEFKALITDINNHMYNIIDSINSKIKPREAAINWMKTYLKYRQAEELFEFGRKYKGDLPTDYYSFISDYKTQDINDLKCSQYYEDFIGEYYFKYQFGKNDKFKQARKILSKGNAYKGINLVFDLIDSTVSDPLAKELLFTKICVDFVRDDYVTIDSIYNNRYLQLVSNRNYQDFVKRKIEEIAKTSNVKRTINDLIELEFIGDIFSEINEKHKGKVLYIDMWGTWCKGCIMQFPFSNKLHDSIDNKAIEFIYLCCKSTKESWKKSIDDFKLKGTHYLLTDNQYSIFSGEFDYTGFPRYMIINKKGIIVDEKAKSPNNLGVKDELLALIRE